MKTLKISHFIIALVIILSLVAGGSCSLVTTEPPPGSNEPISPPPTAEDVSPTLSIADVVAMVRPSVVAINTEYVAYDIFNRAYTQRAAGSGWIIDEDGIIVTNNHVVAGAESINVTLDDGRIFPVDMNNVATDAVADLAVLRIDASNLPAVPVGNSDDLRVGDWVVAIGNALGEGISATNGIVSRNDVSITGENGLTQYNLIQTDAAINPGNSGGPLVDLTGQVIGITNAKISAVGIEGMGYAISTHEAMPIIEQLVQTGYVVRPFLGVQNLLTVDPTVASYYGLSVTTGALIRGIVVGGPAETAGLEAGDVITKFGDQDIANVNELLQALYASQVGQEVEITFWRGDSQQTTHIILAETPPPA